MHGLADEPQFQHRAHGADEAGVRGAAGGRGLGAAADSGLDRILHAGDERPGLGQEGIARVQVFQLDPQPAFGLGLARLGIEPGHQAFAGMVRVEADVQPAKGLGRDQIGRRIADVQRGQLQIGRLKGLIAVVQPVVGQTGDQPGQDRDRIGRPVRIGDMALLAVDPDPGVERSAPADLDHVTQRMLRGRLADHAGVDDLTLGHQGLNDPFGAVQGRALLVAGDQEGQAAGNLALRQDLRDRRHPGRDAALHVDRAAAIEDAVLHLGLERARGPGLGRTGRHHIGVAGETEVGRGRAAPGVEVLDILELHPPAVEAQPRQGALQQGHRSLIGGGNGGSADQVAGEGDRID